MDLPVSLFSGQSSENLERHSYATFPHRGTTLKGTAPMIRYVYVSLRSDMKAVLRMLLDHMVGLSGKHKHDY